jgi:hypothetical protein
MSANIKPLPPSPVSTSPPLSQSRQASCHAPSLYNVGAPGPNPTTSSNHPNVLNVGKKSLSWLDNLNRLIDIILEVVGLSAAILFGVWSIKSYNAAVAANTMSKDALAYAHVANNVSFMALEQSWAGNVLALISFCVSNPVGLSTQPTA